MKRGRLKKAFSMLMALTIAVGLLPAPAMAAVGDSLRRTPAENQSVLEQLSALNGGDGREAMELLDSLGLLDSRGELNISQSIRLNGRDMTLAQVLTLLEDPETDLTAVAEVDGTSIPLKDLKTIVLIEQELQRIRDTYFSGRPFTGEALANLDSLMTQLQTQGITMKAAPGAVRDNALDMSVVQNNSWNSSDLIGQNKGFSERVVAEQRSIHVPAGETVHFSYRVLSGSLGPNMLNFRVKVTYEGNINGTRHDSASDPPHVEMQGGEQGQTYMLTVEAQLGSRGQPELFGQATQGMSGVLRGCLEFYDLKNMTIYDGANYRDSYQLPVTVTKDKPISLPNGTQSDWLLSVKTANSYERGMTDGVEVNELKTPRWYLWKGMELGGLQAQEEAMLAQANLQYTAEQLFGGTPHYMIEAVLGLWGIVRTSDPGANNGRPANGYMMKALPRPMSQNSQMDIVSYSWNGYDVRHENGQIHNLSGGSYIGNPFIMIQEDGLAGMSADKCQSVAIETIGKRNTQGFVEIPDALLSNWPEEPIFVENFVDPYGPSGVSDVQFDGSNSGQYLDSCTISLYNDKKGPDMTISVPAGTYRTGMQIPITLTFSEPVKLDQVKLSINGAEYTGAQLQMNTGGKSAVAWYTVKDVDNAELTVTGVSGVTDVFGNAMDTTNFQAYTAPSVVLESVLMKNALTGINTNYDGGRLSVTLDVNQAQAYRQKYWDKVFQVEAAAPDGTVKSALCTLTEPDKNLVVPTAVLEGILPMPQEQIWTIRVRCYENADDTAGTLSAVSTTLTVPARVDVSGVTVKPPNNERTLSLASAGGWPELQVEIAPANASYPSGSWSSSDEAIATVDAQNRVCLHNKVGRVTLTYTADNGTPDDQTDDKSDSVTYTVVAGDSPALVIPGNASTILARQNAPATVLWSSNAEAFTSSSFTYQVELFRGNYSDLTQLEGKEAVFASTVSKDKNSLVIPGDQLGTLSVGSVPAYTVRVSMPHPKATNATLSALAWIVVDPQPAKARLTPPASLYLTDSESAVIGWSIDNFVTGGGNGTSAALTITRVTGDSEGTVICNLPVPASGSYELKPEKVQNGLKETYMVNLSVQNQGDAAPNVDAFPLYVYRNDALAIEKDGRKITDLTMDNSSKVNGYTPASQAETNASVSRDLLALREELALIEYVAINYEDYSWSQLNDRIKWSASSPGVTINYKQGGLYENIEKFGLNAYLPETEMALSSVTDGTAVITATHANTGMKASVKVDVRTLRNKFFLFQLTPMVETSLTYTDGKGVEKTVTTNSEGMLALYEPDGIAGNVSLKSKVEDKVYLGTIYRENLLSGERDATKLMLYPLNTFKLRQVARVDLYLTNPDGTAYSGSAVLRGGVYKNDGYCQTAGLGDSPDNAGRIDGKTGQTVRVTDGRLPVYLDSTQFWSEELNENSADADRLKATDRLQYIFEITDIESNRYYPVLAYANGNLTLDDIMRSAGSVLTLEEVRPGQANKPFLSNQFMDYGLTGGRLIDVRHSTGHVGPNSAYPETVLKSTMLLWGAGDVQTTDYKVTIADEFGYEPGSQTSETITYPFSTIPVVNNDLKLSEETVTGSGWLADGKDTGMRVRLSKGGRLLLDQALEFRLMDMTRVEKVTESRDVTRMLEDLKKDSALSSGNGGDGGGNVILSVLGGVLGDLSGPINGTNFKMIISPNEDNTKFNAFIWAGYDSVGLDDVDYGETGVALDYGLMEGSLSAAPSLNDIADMARGSSADAGGSGGQTSPDPDPAPAAGRSARKWDRSVDFGGQLEGYYEAEIAYNFTEQKWEIYTLGGGFTAGFSGGVSFGMTTFVGPVPVFADFGLGGAIQLDFKSAVRYSEQDLAWDASVTGSTVNDYLTTLRLNAYVNAFGGIGLDYAIVSMKVGLFGGLNVDNSNVFLSRTYLENEDLRQVNGQRVGIGGEVGIKFEVSLLSLLSYECVLASGSAGYAANFGQLDYINNYWTNTGSGREVIGAAVNYAARNGMRVADASATLQTRDYLKEYERVWGGASLLAGLFSLDASNRLENLQSNAHPGSYPVVTGDGQLLAYVSDENSSNVYDSRVYMGELSGDSYTQGDRAPDPGEFTGFGDSGLALDGSGSFASAAWVRLGAAIEKNATESVSLEEQNLLMNSSEIVASVYENGRWSSTRLTANHTPDMAPVTAVNGSDRAIVAWRSVYAGNPRENGNTGSNGLLKFTTRDVILYSIYSNGAWSEARELYNGSSGAVKALQAAMLPDGTAALVYTLDRSGAGKADSTAPPASSYETAYTLVDPSGEPGLTMIATKDGFVDENPQITVADFGSNDYRFVMGWHSVENGVGDIRLLAVDGSGAMSNTFPASISQVVEQNSVTIGGEFRFARTNAARNSLTDLAILWPEQAVNANNETDHSVLKAVKFRRTADQGVGLSAALEVAELPGRTLLDHFDAYVSGENEIRAVLQGTWYDPDQNQLMGTAAVPKEKTMLYTAVGEFRNKAELTTLTADYANLELNSRCAVQFTLFNAGLEDITSVNITLGGEEYAFTELALSPNQSRTLTVWHPIGRKVENQNYTVSAVFADGGTVPDITGVLFLDYPDVGISRMQTVEESLGKRVVRMTLYNESAAKLSGSGRAVELRFCTDGRFSELADVTCGSGASFDARSKVLTVSGDQDLELIDRGAYTVEVTYDVGSFVRSIGEEEIPDSGVRLFARASVLDGGKTLPEYNSANNEASVRFDSLLRRTGELTTLNTEQQTGGGVTTATITLRNNSLKNQTGEGSVIATLLDARGNVLEQQQTDIRSGELQGEENRTANVTFSRQGDRVTAVYGTLDGNSGLNTLTFEGLPVRLSDFADDQKGGLAYTVEDVAVSSTLVTAVSGSSTAEITIGGEAFTGTGSRRVSIPSGSSSIVVTCGDETYTLNLVRPGGGGSAAVDRPVTVPSGVTGGVVEVSPKYASRGDTVTVSVRPDRGRRLSSLTVTIPGGEEIRLTDKGGGEFTFVMPDASVTINAVFCSSENPFLDVKETDYFYQPVLWAAANNITAGTGLNTFSPNDACTRAQIVTFLWNASGQPKPAGSANPFRDVDRDDWFCDAVLWAVEENITAGVSADEFGPGLICTRAQAMTFLYKYLGKPAARAEMPFSDVTEEDWYYRAVEWAVDNEHTAGTSATTFGSGDDCTRAQIVTFLYRALNK